MRLLYILLSALFFSLMSCGTETTNKKNKINNLSPTMDIENSLFVNTTWLLESIAKKKILYPADYRQNFVIFKGEVDGFTLSGFAACNNFSGKYDVGDHETFGIDKIISTKMACSFMDLENRFIELLKNADNYKIDGFYLTMYKGEKELAVFKDAKEIAKR